MGIETIFLALIAIVVAAIAWVILKKAVKIAIRTIVVFLVLAIAIAGGIAFYFFSGTNEAIRQSTSNKNTR